MPIPCSLSAFRVQLSQANNVRVGIAVLGSAIGISSTEGRDRLVKDLNKQKKVPLEAVPIQGISGTQISAEARENREFVVFPTVVDAQKQGQVRRSDGEIAPDIPNFHASVEYKVYVSGFDAGGEQ